MRYRVGIVGGGAAGMMAAITAAVQGAEVTILEGNDRLGKKILSTGNGKCNLGNEQLDSEKYYTGNRQLLEKSLDRFGTEDTLSFFRSIGLMIKSRNGYLYPMCEQASAVLDVLRYQVAELGIKVVTECRIEEIEARGIGKSVAGGIFVRGNGKSFQFDRVILACGGCAAPKTGSDGSGFRLAKMLGHRISPLVPALVQLRCAEEYFKSVAGVRAEAMLTVFHEGEAVTAERGELLLTDYGISGIPVFQISRVVNYILLEGEEKYNAAGSKAEERQNNAAARKNCDRTDRKKRMKQTVCEQTVYGRQNTRQNEVEVVINFMDGCPYESFEVFHAERLRLQGDRTVEEFFTGMLHKKLMLLFIKLAGLKPSEKISLADPKKVQQVYGLCSGWKVHVTGSNSYDNAQVCAGGVSLDEVTENLESKKARGIYFAGEILDVDGRCGGYNLQWAWSSGYLAGQAAARDINF